MISYCVACYRPAYARVLISELIAKTSVPFELLLSLNVANPEFEQFLTEHAARGAPLRIVRESRENIGMAAYAGLFDSSRFDLVAQIDDDVLCISPGIAEVAQATFAGFPAVGMLTADVWQDEFTTGARPPIDVYSLMNREFGLYDGTIDGWFAIYRRDLLRRCHVSGQIYQGIGASIKNQLRRYGKHGLLSTRMKVFHATGPFYASYFGMLDAEIAKYEAVGRTDMVQWYRREQTTLPAREVLADRVEKIREHLSKPTGIGAG